jgi:Protein of unknown function (DUF2845)
VKVTVTSVVSIVVALSCGDVLADSFRCGTYVIREGLPLAEIVAKCGQPESVETVEEPIMARQPDGSLLQVGTTTREYWTYDRGSGKFPARLTVKGQIATEIELLSRK